MRYLFIVFQSFRMCFFDNGLPSHASSRSSRHARPHHLRGNEMRGIELRGNDLRVIVTQPAINAIFKKWQGSTEEVILELVKNKRIPCLLYGLECFALPKSALRSLDFVVVRFLMKLFRTVL